MQYGQPRPIAPLHTRHTAFNSMAPYLTLEETRNELALFSDTSQDALLADYLLAAAERVSAEVGALLPDVEVTDYWRPRLSDIYQGAEDSLYHAPALSRYQLSQRTVIDSTTFVVSAYLAEDVDTLATVDAAGYVVDITGPLPVLRFAADAVPELAGQWEAPLRCAYTPAGFGDDYPVGFEQVRQAMRYCVATWFEHRGSTLPESWERGLASLGRPGRRVAF